MLDKLKRFIQSRYTAHELAYKAVIEDTIKTEVNRKDSKISNDPHEAARYWLEYGMKNRDKILAHVVELEAMFA